MSVPPLCFSVHHELALSSYVSATGDWAAAAASDNRCELGRSANTMHLFPALYGSNSQTVTFGDTEAESSLIEMIIEEQRDEQLKEMCGPDYISKIRTRTCILYPTTDSILLPVWLAQNCPGEENRPSAKPNTCTNSTSSVEDEKYVINLVVLDGTYSQAARQIKHIRNMIKRINTSRDILPSHFVPPLRPYTVPVVHLDLGASGQCASAIIGVMSQPTGDKVCSLQATNMALRQVGVDSSVCDQLEEDLTAWLEHILSSKIKMGKSVIRAPIVGTELGDLSLFQPLKAVTNRLAQLNGHVSQRRTDTGHGKRIPTAIGVVTCEWVQHDVVTTAPLSCSAASKRKNKERKVGSALVFNGKLNLLSRISPLQREAEDLDSVWRKIRKRKL